jgi:hypothetical protein
VTRFLHQITGLAIVIAPEVGQRPAPTVVTLTVHDMALRDLLAAICRDTGTCIRVQDQTILIGEQPPAGVRPDLVLMPSPGSRDATDAAF